MLIQRDQLVAGRSAVEMRDLMRRLRDTAHSVAALSHLLGITPTQAQSLADDLRAAGLVESTTQPVGLWRIGPDEDDTGDHPPVLVPTIAGNALAKAKIGKPMPRSRAQELCDQVIARAEEINGSDDWLYWIVELGLYGSFAMPGDGPVGDVDLAVRLQRRYEEDDYIRRNLRMIGADDVRVRNVLDSVTYAEVKLLRYLRGRSPRVDLVETGPRGYGLPPDVTPTPVYQFSPSV